MGRGQEHKGGSRAHDVHEPWGWGGERPMSGMKNNALVIKKKTVGTELVGFRKKHTSFEERW